MPNKHSFVEEIEKQLKRYETEKGHFRRNISLLSHSNYIKDLMRVHKQIQHKENMTMFDLKWFYKECYFSFGKYCKPQFYMEESPSLSAQIYQHLGDWLKINFRGSFRIYSKAIKGGPQNLDKVLQSKVMPVPVDVAKQWNKIEMQRISKSILPLIFVFRKVTLQNPKKQSIQFPLELFIKILGHTSDMSMTEKTLKDI